MQGQKDKKVNFICQIFIVVKKLIFTPKNLRIRRKVLVLEAPSHCFSANSDPAVYPVANHWKLRGSLLLLYLSPVSLENSLKFPYQYKDKLFLSAKLNSNQDPKVTL